MAQAAGRLLLGCLLATGLMGAVDSAVTPETSAPVEAVGRLLGEFAGDLHDPSEQAAMTRLITVFTERGTVNPDPKGAWVLLTFDRNTDLAAVEINAEHLLSAPSLIQHAVLVHELEHLKRAKDTRRLLEAVSQSGQAPEAAGPLHKIVRALVDDEYHAYRREILYVHGVVNASGGLQAYLNTVPPGERLAIQQYYQQSIGPFLTAAGEIHELRLRRDFVFFRTFPRRYRRYYEAALAWEALQGHVEIQRRLDGTLRPARLLSPTAFLAWLVP